MQKDFSYPVKIADLNQQEQHYKLIANTEELKILAQILKVEDVKKFKSEIYLKLNLKQHRLDLWGDVEAEIEQKSVISLENFVKKYQTPFSYVFDTQAKYRDIKELEAGINEDVPDIIENGEIDLGSIAIEQIALILDDYPRRDGEVFSFQSEFDEETTIQSNPFSVLKNLKK